MPWNNKYERQKEELFSIKRNLLTGKALTQIVVMSNVAEIGTGETEYLGVPFTAFLVN